MNKNELKKFLYLNKPVAVFQYMRKGSAYYKSVVGDVELIYNIPFEDMAGDADFLPEMEGKFLARWVDESLTT